jgi:hypothetical protein
MHDNAAFMAALMASCFALGAATERSAFADEKVCTSAHVSVDENNRKVTVSFHNRCETHVGCRVEWQLRCGKGSFEHKQEEVRIEGRSDNAVVASATSCSEEEAWRINPPRWRCEEPDTQPVVERSSGTKKKRR